ncbi:type I restriction enzyme endonuclease domain-containing protein [Francisella persica]|uniref:type I restriction enzyme endonuclease domain-containing protein n=1 Tax=Francisella persica TaxID=954 RepID=UPI000B062CA5|nr:type I restriction enzyme endonuclease domain-containing protein [Francisella persica]
MIFVVADAFNDHEKDLIHFYLVIRSIVVKPTKGKAQDTAQMNRRVANMIENAIKNEKVEEIFKLDSNDESKIHIFDKNYLIRLIK